MSTLCRSLDSWRRAARLATLVMVFSAACIVVAHAQTQNAVSTQSSASPEASVPSQAPASTPEALFEDSTLSATTNTINVNWLPIIKGDGTIIYDDVVIQFDVASDGTLTVASGYPVVTPSPIPITNHFKAGIYLGPDDSTELIQVSGPALAPGGATEWTIKPANGSSGCLYPYSASWWVGPIKKSPFWQRIMNAKVPVQGYSYGVGSGTLSGCDGTHWGQNSLLGFSQVGNSLTIFSFSIFGSQDHNEPVDQRTYCLVGSKGCGK